ncbi:acetamidase/formamidase family protein [Actinomadura craniellae]|uniref:acetamidase/formamidase family protein n=1 Tax=Actinomadura craniellae TaxID=2231787 RepID=UPI001F447575|nr:acetamidase/formamidase family protein [Actinomadura craniellae]
MLLSAPEFTTGRSTQAVPGHNRWHPELPAVAELISGGSVRMDCEAARAGTEAVLCGPLSVLGAEPGDVIVVDVLGVGRADGHYAGGAHPGVLGCAPAATALGIADPEPEGALLGHVRPGLDAYPRIAARALRSAARGQEIGRCDVARLTAGSRILLPVHVPGAKLSVGDLHFPERGAPDCRPDGPAGWIDIRVNLTKRGIERFRVTSPLLMPDPDQVA